MEVEKKLNVSFGTTTNRLAYPFDVGKSRFGNSMNPITGVPNVGPGKYNNDERTSMVHILESRPMSNQGYSLGARKVPRSQKFTFMDTPAPGAYDRDGPMSVKPAYKPFNTAVDRDASSKRRDLMANPGPGSYETRTVGCHRVQYAQSFGGEPSDLPCVTQTSTIPRNTDKLPTTREEKRYLRKLAYLKLYY